MKINGRKIRSKSMRERRNWKRKLSKINKERKNYIMERKIEKKLRMKFLTNLSNDEKSLYIRAAVQSGLDFRIIDNAYYKNGDGVIKYMCAIYVAKKDKRLWKFWDIIMKDDSMFSFRPRLFDI